MFCSAEKGSFVLVTSTQLERLIERAAELIGRADAIVITSGAGMGVDSGLPDFRGTEGLWGAYPALGQAKLRFVQIAAPEQFSARPALAWGFYGHRLQMYRRTEPHAGFRVLQSWAAAKPHGAFAVTSNVDGQFQKAGFSDARVCEIHGSIHHLQCLEPCRQELWSAEGFDPVIDEVHCLLVSEAPQCPHCGKLARPNVLMFGDHRWVQQRSADQHAAFDAWLARVEHPVVIECGAGTALPTIRQFGHRLALHRKAALIRINPREAELQLTGVALPLSAREALERIDAHL